MGPHFLCAQCFVGISSLDLDNEVTLQMGNSKWLRLGFPQKQIWLEAKAPTYVVDLEVTLDNINEEAEK